MVLGLLIMRLFSCEDLSHRLECCNYFLVETSRSSLGVGSILGSRPLAVVRAVELFGWRPLAAVRVLELFLGRDLSREVDARTYPFIVLLSRLAPDFLFKLLCFSLGDDASSLSCLAVVVRDLC